MIEKHLVFKGCVQGVGFRYTAQRYANQFSLTGWVKNLADGNVEMLAQGKEEDVGACLQSIATHFDGSIINIQESVQDVLNKHTSFQITYE